MNTIDLVKFRNMFLSAQEIVQKKSDEFSQLDAVIGDGDHGTAIVQALNAAIETLDVDSDFKTVLESMGMNVMLKTSGSTSTLLGGFLLGMSDSVTGKELDCEAVKNMFLGGLDGVRKQTKALPGDKTMMDALYPGVKAMELCKSDQISTLFRECANAAIEGAEKTINMKANFGRARNYGEKSIGCMDSGAASWSCILKAFADSLN